MELCFFLAKDKSFVGRSVKERRLLHHSVHGWGNSHGYWWQKMTWEAISFSYLEQEIPKLKRKTSDILYTALSSVSLYTSIYIYLIVLVSSIAVPNICVKRGWRNTHEPSYAPSCSYNDLGAVGLGTWSSITSGPIKCFGDGIFLLTNCEHNMILPWWLRSGGSSELWFQIQWHWFSKNCEWINLEYLFKD